MFYWYNWASHRQQILVFPAYLIVVFLIVIYYIDIMIDAVICKFGMYNSDINNDNYNTAITTNMY